FGRVCANCPPGILFDFEFERGGESNRAQHAQTIFAETVRRVTDRTNYPGFEVRAPVNEIDDFAGDRISEHSIYREVAPLRVHLRRGKSHVDGMPSINISAIGTES